ncbi:uncharacterized protein HMPREF1541_07120 [Cyphellophora europaea CBS 101466]|uniref:Xylanolytic transcriptional activator regulatory domain-containing protein n=1 Tax=Cyphellophora europaea (strain CBS 101466) TaxID=1220924 RepID=W2RP84_CYPE1|nr:uncharacterized protein HMPREF1541_07120 [Cyphellophora europaea CBS 101466]ETN37498.1 hypothetical protein HMPREF1541_07120 [Cyphellophora europaea CBS 101466]
MASTLTGFPRRPTLYTLSAYIFSQSQFVREEEFSDGPEFITTSFRVALGMGLHRKLEEAGFTATEQETRRRLWWYILHLDVMSSCSSGLSPLYVDEKMGNSPAISTTDLLEHVRGSGQGSVQLRLPDIRYVVAKVRYETTKVIRGILLGHFEEHFTSLEAVSETASSIESLGETVKTAIDRILQVGSKLSRHELLEIYQSENLAVPEGASTINDTWRVDASESRSHVVGFAIWATSLLHLMLHKAYCILYFPLAKDQHSDFGADIRLTAIKHAQAFLQLFIRVCDAPFSSPFHWMYPGTYQPLQAMSLLLADLLNFPHSDEAPTSQGLVDAIFDLYQVDQGMITASDPPRRRLSPSGREVWSMLGRLRNKAFEQMDQDPHVVLPTFIASSHSR